MLVATAGSVYLIIGYFATVSANPSFFAILLGIAPLFAIALTAAWNSNARIPLLAVCAACIAVLTIKFDYLRHHLAWLYFMQHAGAMSLLGITFGSTLNRGDEGALCSRIAIFILHDQMDADYLRYTWKVTFAWTIFFCASALLSVLLFFFGPIEAWSIFANLLTPILIGAMFAGEYLIRLRLMGTRAHLNVAQTIDAYRKYSRSQRS